MSSSVVASPNVPTLNEGLIGIKSKTSFAEVPTVGWLLDSETILNVGAGKPSAEVFQYLAKCLTSSESTDEFNLSNLPHGIFLNLFLL